MSSRDETLLGWATDSIRRTWRKANVEQSVALRGDLSARRFWRIHLSGIKNLRSAILVDLGPDDLPGYARALKLVDQPLAAPPWITVHRFLAALGVPVPRVYALEHQLRAMLVEDVGHVSLIDAARGNPPETADLFRAAAELLLRLHVEGTRALTGDLLPAKIAYDRRLFRWELKEFLDLGCAALGTGMESSDLTAELEMLADRLGQLPRVFSHRDFHGQNLFVQRAADDQPRLRVIDFQDALMAPAAQDLAVLLTTRDMAALITPALERRILEFYYSGLLRRRAASLNAADFFASYELCVLQHAIKMTGRFLMFERSGKSEYGQFVPHTIAQARRMLGGSLGAGFPRLARAFGVAPGGEVSR